MHGTHGLLLVCFIHGELAPDVVVIPRQCKGDRLKHHTIALAIRHIMEGTLIFMRSGHACMEIYILMHVCTLQTDC